MQKKNLFQELFFSNKNFVWRENFFIMKKKNERSGKKMSTKEKLFAVLISPSRKYWDSYYQACKESEKAGERSFLHDLKEFAHLKKGEDNNFAAYQKGITRQLYFENVNGESKMLNVPSTTYWLVDEKEYIGIGILRHRLTKAIEEYGAHIGYAIRLGKRNQGYGTLLLRFLLQEAYRFKINPALITCSEDNIASKTLIEHAGGILRDKLPSTEHGKPITLCRYWVKTDPKSIQKNKRS